MATGSAQLFERARKLVPAGVNSNTRARTPHPLYFQAADGPWLTDADGRQWLDMVMGNGAVLLGHNHPAVQDAVRQAVDEIQPLVSDLMSTLGKVPHAPCASGKAALKKWLVQLNAMRAAQEIDEDQARQLSFDLDSAYSEFHQALSSNAKQ